MAKNTQWTADPKAEAVLKELGMAYTIGKIVVAKIDWKATHTNIGRTGRAINQDNADDYALAMQSGAIFPMPVAIKRRNGPTVVAGVHRSMAAKQNGDSEIECYIVEEQNEAMERLIAIMTNRKEGVRVSKSEAMEYGVYLVSEYEMEAKQVADYLGLNHKSLADKLRIIERRSELVSLGFTGELTDTAVGALSTVANNHKTLLSAAELASKYQMTAPEVRDLSSRVAKNKTEAQQLAAIELEESRRRKVSPTPVHHVTASTRTKFLRIWHSLLSLMDGKETIESLQIVRASDEHKQLTAEWKQLKRQLDKVTQ